MSTSLSARGRTRRSLLELLAIRPGEGERTLLVFLYLLLIIGSYLLIKAIRNSLFISEFGAVKLPYVMLGIAGLAAMFAAVYIRLARRFDSIKLTFWTLLFFASNVFVFWWLALQGRPWLYPVIYLWAGVFGVIAPVQVWTLANELFTTREAKRLFGVVGAGGILGAALGGWAAGQLAPRIGTTHLMLLVASLLVLAAGTVRLLQRHRGRGARRADEDAPKNLTQSLKSIGSSGHLKLLAALVFISALATTSVDFQFSLMAERSFSERDQLTAFFGLVYGAISLLSFVLQILLTSRALALVGVGASILLLPIGLMTGTVALFATQSLWAAVLLKGSDGALKHSLDRSCRELMYLPVPARIKLHAKSTIDTVMDRLGDGSAGALQLLITSGLGWGLRGSLAANAVVLVGWLAVALRLKGAYVEQLRSVLQKPRVTPVPLAIDDADTRQTLQTVLREGSDADRLGALEWISQNSVTVDEELLLEQVRGESSQVARAALAILLRGEGEAEFPPELLSGLDDAGQAVLVSAIDLLVDDSVAPDRVKLEALLDTAGQTTQLSLVAYMVRRMGDEFEPFALRVFDTLLAPDAPPHARCAAVRALALLPAASTVGARLGPLFDDADATLAAAAIETAGVAQRADLLPRIVAALSRPRLRAAARRSLIGFGDRAVPVLIEAFTAAQQSAALRKAIPAVLAEQSTPAAIAMLVRGVEDGDYEVRGRCVDALHRAKRRQPQLKALPQRVLVSAVSSAVAEHARLLRAVNLVELAGSGGPSHEWLLDALREEAGRLLERIFKLLGLGCSMRDMSRSWMSVRYGSPAERANAIELLDNLLPGGVKGAVVALLEERHVESSRGAPGEDIWRELVSWPSRWIAACGWYAARAGGIEGLDAAARLARESEDPLVRAEASAYLGRQELA